MNEKYGIPSGDEIFENDSSLNAHKEQLDPFQGVEPEPEVKPTGSPDARQKKKE
jgi:hypothetical protein